MRAKRTVMCAGLGLLLAAGCGDDTDPVTDSSVDQSIDGGLVDVGGPDAGADLTVDGPPVDLPLADTTVDGPVADMGDAGSSDMIVDSAPPDSAPDMTADTGTTPDAAPDSAATDGAAPDTMVADMTIGDGSSAAICATGETVRIEEVGPNTPDFVVLKNTGTSQVDISGYMLETHGVSKVTYTLPSGTKLAAGAKVYIYEYTSGGTGTNVLQTGANLPFYNGISSNSALLWNTGSKLVDYVAMGTTTPGLPTGASATVFSWPSGFSSTDSVQRSGSSGVCPSFKGSDWTAKTATTP